MRAPSARYHRAGCCVQDRCRGGAAAKDPLGKDPEGCDEPDGRWRDVDDTCDHRRPGDSREDWRQPSADRAARPWMIASGALHSAKSCGSSSRFASKFSRDLEIAANAIML